MASTVQSILDRFAVTYPDCPATMALTLFSETYSEVTARCELRGTELDVSLTNGVREYAIADTVFEIYEAYYKITSDSSEWRVLLETSIDTQSTLRKGWRIGEGQTAGGPLMYYVTSSLDGNTASWKVGFDPIPDTTTVAGYPKVTLFINKHGNLATTDTVPGTLLNDAVFTMGMCYKWSQMQYQKDSPTWLNLYEMEMQKNVSHVKSMLLQRDTYFVPNAYRRRMI